MPKAFIYSAGEAIWKTLVFLEVLTIRYFMVVTLAHHFSAVSAGALIFTIGDPSVLEPVQREAFFFCDDTFHDGHDNHPLPCRCPVMTCLTVRRIG